MAKITRRMAINNAHNILRNYKKKITDAEQYKEYLPLAGQKIVERYVENRDNYKNLLDSAADSKEFFIGMDDETLVSYANICDRLNNIFDLNVSESRKINGFIDEQFVVRSAEEVITGIRTVEIGRKVEYKLGTPDLYDAKETLAGLIGRYYVEWEVEDIDNNFSAEHNRAEAIVENIADFLDYNFSNPYDRTFNAVKEGHYIIKAKVHDILAGENIVDTIEFEQVVETGDETIMSMDLQQKILRALQLIDWKVDLDFAALTEALFKATGVIIAIAAIATIAPEVAAAIVAIMTIGMGIDAAINIIKGIVQLAEALELIQKARSERALQVGGEKIKEGILNIGVGIIEVLLQKMTMKNLAQARVQVLKNVTPTVQALPQTGLPGTADTLGIAAQSTTKLPALTASTNEVSIILNKSAVQAMENVAQMSVLQSEKVALQEMVADNLQIEIDKNNAILSIKNEICSKTIPNEIYSALEASPKDYQLELFNMLSNDIKYQLVQSDKCKWITDELFGYDITKENVSDYLKLEYIDGDMKINLDWPFYGGYKPESIKGLDYLFTKGDGKIEISRMGGDFGVALGYGRNADGTFPSAAARSLLKTEKQSFVTTGIMDLKKYKDIVDVFADKDLNNKSRLKLLKEKYNISIAKFNLLKNDFLNFPKRSEIAGENSIKDAIRIFQLDVDNEIYGYCGQAEKWNDLEGGANQMNTVFSLNTMIKCGIITNVKRNVPIRSK